MSVTKVSSAMQDLTDDYAFSGTVTGTSNTLEFVETNAITAATSIRASASAAWEVGYDYIVVLEGCSLTTDNEILYMRFSDDNSNFEADASDYDWSTWRSAAHTDDAADAQVRVTGAGTWGNDSGNSSTIQFTFINPMGTSEESTVFWIGQFGNGSGQTASTSGAAIFSQGTVAVQAVQWFWSGGSTFKAQGDITVWRRKRS